MPTYGIRSSSSQLPIAASFALVQLWAAARQVQTQLQNPWPVIIVSLDEVDRTDYTRLVNLLAVPRSEPSAQLSNEQVRLAENRGSHSSLVRKIKDFWNRTATYIGNLVSPNPNQTLRTAFGADLTSNDLDAILQDLTNNPGKVGFLQLGRVPTVIYNTFFFRSTLPGVFEGQGTAGV